MAAEFRAVPNSVALDPKILQQPWSRLHLRHKEMVTPPCAGDMQQTSLRVVDLFEV